MSIGSLWPNQPSWAKSGQMLPMYIKLHYPFHLIFCNNIMEVFAMKQGSLVVGLIKITLYLHIFLAM